MCQTRLLVVAHDDALRESLSFALAAEGIPVTAIKTLSRTVEARFDVAVLDSEAVRLAPRTADDIFLITDSVIVLGDEESLWSVKKPLLFVQKPLRGNELLSAINVALADVA